MQKTPQLVKSLARHIIGRTSTRDLIMNAIKMKEIEIIQMKQEEFDYLFEQIIGFKNAPKTNFGV